MLLYDDVSLLVFQRLPECSKLPAVRRQGPRHADFQRHKLALGTWNVTLLTGKEPELVCEVEWYQLAIVGLTLHTVWALEPNSWSMSSTENAESEDFEENLPIILVEVAEVVKKLPSSEAGGKICPEILKAFDIVGLAWLTHLFNVAWRSGTTPVEWQTVVVVPIF